MKVNIKGSIFDVPDVEECKVGDKLVVDTYNNLIGTVCVLSPYAYRHFRKEKQEINMFRKRNVDRLKIISECEYERGYKNGEKLCMYLFGKVHYDESAGVYVADESYL